MAHRVAAPRLGLKFSTVVSFHDTVLQPGLNLGMFWEDYQGYGGQLFKLADTTCVAGDALYYKSYSAKTVTPTIGNSSSGELAGFATCSGAVGEYLWVLKKTAAYAVKANGVFARGTPLWPDSGNNRVIPGGVFSGSLGATDNAGDIISLANPSTSAWMVTSLVLTTTVKSTGASTADFGIAANGTTSAENLIDSIDLGTATVTNANNAQNGGTNGKGFAIGAAGTFLTGSKASGAMAGLVGTYSGMFRMVGAPDSQPRIIGYAQGAISSGKVTSTIDLPYLG